MRHTHSRIVATIALLLLAISSVGQRLEYDVDFVSYFDNREYEEQHQLSQTLYGFRLSPAVGVSFRDSLMGEYELMGGVHYRQPMGAGWRKAQFIPTAYLSMHRRGFSVMLGAIPYAMRRHALPHYLRYDSLIYARPNVEGAYMRYEAAQGYGEFMCDWRGMPTWERREMFLLLLNGEYQWRWLLLGGYAQLNHKASYGEGRREGVCDDAYLHAYLGLDLGVVTGLDSLTLRCGYIQGFQRERESGTVYKPGGAMVELTAQWRWLGIASSFYYGTPLMPLYAKYGSDLNQGDPFYQSPWYSRTAVYAYLFSNAFVNCYFSWNFHVDDTKRVSHQQQLVGSFCLNRLMTKSNGKLGRRLAQ